MDGGVHLRHERLERVEEEELDLSIGAFADLFDDFVVVFEKSTFAVLPDRFKFRSERRSRYFSVFH